MPTVPYKPYPAASAQMIATPRIHEDTPGAAFGTNIAEGISSIGKGLEHAGDEIFRRALGLQELKNETEAKEADASYMIETGKLHAEFSSLQGKSAVDAYPQYIENLKALRTKVRDGLSNDAAKRMYDGASLSTMGRTIFNGAGHAATENKRWHAGVAEARIDAFGSSVYNDPNDDTLYERSIRSVANEVEGTLAPIHGWGPEQAGMETNKRVSKITAQRIIGLSRREPYRAQEMFEKYKENLHDNDRFTTENAVTNSMRAVGSANLADSVYLAGREEADRAGKPLREMEEEVREKSKKIAPNDPIFVQHSLAALQSAFNKDKYARTIEEREHLSTLNNFIISNSPRSLQELKADPKANAAFEELGRLNPAKARSIPNAIKSWIKSQDQEANQDEYYRLAGMSLPMVGNVKGFLEEDILNNDKLNGRQKLSLLRIQDQRKQKAEADPRVTYAMRVLEPDLAAAGISRTRDPDSYNHFLGALQDRLEMFQGESKQAPKAEEIRKIGSELLQQKVVPRTWYWPFETHEDPVYNVKVPSDYIRTFKAEKPDASDEEIRRDYIRRRLIELYKTKKAE